MDTAWIRFINSYEALGTASGRSGCIKTWMVPVPGEVREGSARTSSIQSKLTVGVFFLGRIALNWSTPIRSVGEPGCMKGGAYLPTLLQLGSLGQSK